MTTAELKLIERALGAKTVNALAEVATEPDQGAWIRLAVAVTMAVFQELHNSPPIAALVQALWIKAGYGPPQHHAPCDAYVADPCYSFLEVWPVVARDLVKTGLAAEAESDLRSGMTVRAMLRARYGIKAGPEKYPAMERRAFLRTLRSAQRAASN
jgi:hypothetical protein